MGSKRSNPVTQMQKRVGISQNVVNPQGNGGTGGKPGQKLMVPQNKSSKISQSVGNPSLGKSRSGSDVVTPGKQSR